MYPFIAQNIACRHKYWCIEVNPLVQPISMLKTITDSVNVSSLRDNQIEPRGLSIFEEAAESATNNKPDWEITPKEAVNYAHSSLTEASPYQKKCLEAHNNTKLTYKSVMVPKEDLEGCVYRGEANKHYRSTKNKHGHQISAYMTIAAWYKISDVDLEKVIDDHNAHCTPETLLAAVMVIYGAVLKGHRDGRTDVSLSNSYKNKIAGNHKTYYLAIKILVALGLIEEIPDKRFGEGESKCFRYKFTDTHYVEAMRELEENGGAPKIWARAWVKSKPTIIAHKGHPKREFSETLRSPDSQGAARGIKNISMLYYSGYGDTTEEMSEEERKLQAKKKRVRFLMWRKKKEMERAKDYREKRVKLQSAH